MKVRVKSIAILWSESPSFPSRKRGPARVFRTWEAAELALASAARRVRGGYDKTAFCVTWADGHTYEGRIDLTPRDHAGKSRPLGEHIEHFAGASAGRVVPLSMGRERLEEYIAASARRRGETVEAYKAGWARVLDEYKLRDDVRCVGCGVEAEPCLGWALHPPTCPGCQGTAERAS